MLKSDKLTEIFVYISLDYKCRPQQFYVKTILKIDHKNNICCILCLNVFIVHQTSDIMAMSGKSSLLENVFTRLGIIIFVYTCMKLMVVGLLLFQR